MNAGPLDKLLTFERNTTPEGQDNSGDPLETWNDAFTVYGAFEPVGGREFPASQKINAETTARFRIRFRPGLDAAHYRIRFSMPLESQDNPRTWNIHSILPRGPAELVIEASELV